MKHVRIEAYFAGKGFVISCPVPDEIDLDPNKREVYLMEQLQERLSQEIDLAGIEFAVIADDEAPQPLLDELTAFCVKNYIACQGVNLITIGIERDANKVTFDFEFFEKGVTNEH